MSGGRNGVKLWQVFVVLAVLTPITYLLWPVCACGGLSKARGTTRNRAIVLAQGLKEYAQDHDGFLPPQYHSSADLKRVAPGVKAENFASANPNGGVFLGNGDLAGADLAETPDDAILIYESMPWPGPERRVAVNAKGGLTVVAEDKVDLKAEDAPCKATNLEL